MKRIMCLCLLFVLVIMPLASLSEATPMSVKMLFNGTRLVFVDDYNNILSCYSIDGTVYVPLKELIESIGGSYTYDQDSSTITVTLLTGESVPENKPKEIDKDSPLGLFIFYSEAVIGKSSLIKELKSKGIKYTEGLDYSFFPYVLISGDNGEKVKFCYYVSDYDQNAIVYITEGFELSTAGIKEKDYSYQYKDKKTGVQIDVSTLDALLDKAEIER